MPHLGYSIPSKSGRRICSGGPLHGDANLDGVVNGLAVAPFVEMIVGGGVQAVLEPGSLALAGLAAVLIRAHASSTSITATTSILSSTTLS